MMTKITVFDASGKNTLVRPSMMPRPKPVTIAPRIEPMPPITTTANTTMISSEPICGRDVVDRRRHHAGESRERDAEAVGQRDHARHVDAESAHQRRVLGRGAQIGAEPGALDHEPGAEADGERGDDHPGAIIRQEHEAEVLPAAQRLRQRVRQAGRAELIARDAFNDEREAESQQQAVEMIELVKPLQEDRSMTMPIAPTTIGAMIKRRPIAEPGYCSIR